MKLLVPFTYYFTFDIFPTFFNLMWWWGHLNISGIFDLSRLQTVWSFSIEGTEHHQVCCVSHRSLVQIILLHLQPVSLAWLIASLRHRRRSPAGLIHHFSYSRKTTYWFQPFTPRSTRQCFSLHWPLRLSAPGLPVLLWWRELSSPPGLLPSKMHTDRI